MEVGIFSRRVVILAGREVTRMKMSQEEYTKYVESKATPSPIGKDLLCAFLTGGGICALAQGLGNLYQRLGASVEHSATWATLTLVFLAALLTGLGLFDDIARHAGAGTLVPITGFANAMASPALEFKSEGLILGTGAKLFTVAGPVLVYGISTSVVYGIVLCVAAWIR